MTGSTIGRSARFLVTCAAIAICFAAADTYVVVLAMPDMMTSASLAVDELAKAAPIVSGFLLGYVAVLPVMGRLSDVRGRVPVLSASMIIFALGSALTALAPDLVTIVAGRIVQGIGAGGLIPPTLALVADLWPPERRGGPLGLVGAVQELGSVIGPLFGAVVLQFASWRAIFWINVAIGLVLTACFLALSKRERQRMVVSLSAPLAIAALVSFAMVLAPPQWLASSVELGTVLLPVTGESRWLSPLALTTLALIVGFVIVEWRSRRSIADWSSWREALRAIDPWSVLASTICLGALIGSFSTAETTGRPISETAVWLLPVSVVSAGVFWRRQRRARHPLVPPGSMSRLPARGALLVSFFVGVALISALVDIPFFARLTIHPDSQLGASLVLVQFLVALPIGALAGGQLLRRVPAAALTACGMTMTAISFLMMSQWDAGSLNSHGSTAVLVACGFGFGLAIAPVNAVLLQNTPDAIHGVASALLVTARMVGMLVGISVLTAIGLSAFHGAVADIGPATELCGGTSRLCDAYQDALRDAGLSQLRATFVGAGVAAAIAAAGSALLRHRH